MDSICRMFIVTNEKFKTVSDGLIKLDAWPYSGDEIVNKELKYLTLFLTG